jgi:hypothetical protein
MNPFRKLTLSTLALAALAAACGNKSSQVKASITDAPIDGVSVFKITVSEVRFHLDNDVAENTGEDKVAPAASHQDADDDGARGKGWVVLCTGTQTFDLMTLRPDPTGAKVYAALCSGNAVTVPAGKVDEFWLDVTHVHLEFNNGHAPIDLDLPHGPQSGLKIEVDDDLDKLGEAEVKIDFDTAHSVFQDLNGNYTVRPKLLEVH